MAFCLCAGQWEMRKATAGPPTNQCIRTEPDSRSRRSAEFLPGEQELRGSSLKDTPSQCLVSTAGTKRHQDGRRRGASA